MRAHITAAAGLRHNGWKGLAFMSCGSLVANICVLVPLYFLFAPLFTRSLSSGLKLSPQGAPVGVLAASSFGWSIAMLIGWMGIFLLVTTLATSPFQRWYWNPVIVNGVLRECHCASCGYPLATKYPEPDGCTICSECGAAWKVPVHAARVNSQS